MPVCRHNGCTVWHRDSGPASCMMEDWFRTAANTLLCRLITNYVVRTFLLASARALENTSHEDEIRGDYQFRLCNFFSLLDNSNCVQKLPESELAIVSKTKEYTSMEDRGMETHPKAVRGLIHILPTH